MIEIADTGCGMPPRVAARAFEPFSRSRARPETPGSAWTPHAASSRNGKTELSRAIPAQARRFTGPRSRSGLLHPEATYR